MARVYRNFLHFQLFYRVTFNFNFLNQFEKKFFFFPSAILYNLIIFMIHWFSPAARNLCVPWDVRQNFTKVNTKCHFDFLSDVNTLINTVRRILAFEMFVRGNFFTNMTSPRTYKYRYFSQKPMKFHKI